jgi:hypothetical protein
MPRRRRVFVEGGIYHVYNRFARGADLFADPEEAIEFLAGYDRKTPGGVGRPAARGGGPVGKSWRRDAAGVGRFQGSV